MGPAALLAALGGVTLGFGLLCLLMAVFQPLMPLGWVLGNLLAGGVLLVAAATLGFESLRERMRSTGGRRASVLGTSSLLGAVLGLVFLGLLAFLSTRYSTRFDWTEEHVNTLSDQSLKVVAGLGEPVELIAFFSEQDSSVVRDLLERYDLASEKLTVRFIDPNQRPDLVESHHVDPSDLARGLLLAVRGDQSVTIRSFDEAEITNALVKLTRTASRTIYFLEGHNERRIGPADGGDSSGKKAAEDDVESPEGRAGFARAVAALKSESNVVKPLLLATANEVPEDADAVVIAGPTRPFLDGEREALERYLARGGALLVMIDPRAQTNLYDSLQRWGILVDDDVVVDPVQSVSRQPTAPVVDRFPDHPIGAKLSRAVFSMARSVRPAETASADLVPIVETSPTSWAERDLETWMKTGRAEQDASDLAGPVSIAVAGTPNVEGLAADAKPRIVVFGDSNFATNELLDALDDRDLLLDSVDWLLGDIERISVRPNVSRSSSVSLTAGQLQAIQYLSLFVLPEGIALLGVLTWWMRRRAPAA